MTEKQLHESLRLSRDQMKRLGYQVVDMVVDHIESLPTAPVGRRASRQSLEKLLREPLPEKGSDPQEVLELVKNTVLSNTFNVQHPRFFAFIPGPSNFMSVLADMLATGFNVFAGTWLEGSGPAEVEWVTLDWLRQLFGFPETAGGLFVSGGSVANLTALAVAREVKLQGPVEPAVVYCSDQTHSSIERALRILGLAPHQLHKIPTDDDFRLSLPELQRTIALDRCGGKVPFCVVANAGTTNTGAVDPLDALAEFCREQGLWLHVDGAYGAAAILSERERSRLTGIEQADSFDERSCMDATRSEAITCLPPFPWPSYRSCWGMTFSPTLGDRVCTRGQRACPLAAPSVPTTPFRQGVRYYVDLSASRRGASGACPEFPARTVVPAVLRKP